MPNEDEFASAIPEAHRKSEKAYHVKAFRGSKDGFLFFLSDGVFFGFKKPLLFLGFDDIESISYTSVLQRTFNLSVMYRKPGAEEDEAEEIEFSMLDQADYAGINEYVQKHGLNDASLAAWRRAKSEMEKKAGVANGEAEGAEDDGRTELEKAEQQLQDEESEEDEDFDPSDEGDDGSGSEEEGSDDEDADERPRKDLVKEELGSEAEDVELSDEGDDEGDVDEMEDGEDEDGEEVPDEAPKTIQSPMQPIPQPSVVQGRWGSAVNDEPDPDDEDQL